MAVPAAKKVRLDNPSPFEGLPKDARGVVGAFVFDGSTFQALLLVSKGTWRAFREGYSEAATDFILHGTRLDTPSLNFTIKVHHFLRGQPDVTIQTLLSQCNPHLQEAVFTNAPYREHVDSLTSRCHEMRVLSIANASNTYSPTIQQLTCSNSLIELKLLRAFYISGEVFHDVVERHQNLKALAFSGIKTLKNDHLNILPHTLTDLEISSCPSLTEQGLNTLFTRLTHLQRACIRNQLGFTNNVLLTLARSAPALTHITIHSCAVSKLAEFAASSSQLKALDIRSLAVGKDSLQSVAKQRLLDRAVVQGVDVTHKFQEYYYLHPIYQAFDKGKTKHAYRLVDKLSEKHLKTVILKTEEILTRERIAYDRYFDFVQERTEFYPLAYKSKLPLAVRDIVEKANLYN